MLSAVLEIIDLNVFAYQVILETLMTNVESQSVLQILTVLHLQHVEMKNAQTLVIVLKMQTAQPAIIEEYAIVFLILRETLMEQLVLQVRFYSWNKSLSLFLLNYIKSSFEFDKHLKIFQFLYMNQNAQKIETVQVNQHVQIKNVKILVQLFSHVHQMRSALFIAPYPNER